MSRQLFLFVSGKFQIFVSFEGKIFVQCLTNFASFFRIFVAVCAYQNQVRACTLLGNLVCVLVSCLWYLGFTDTWCSFNLIIIFLFLFLFCLFFLFQYICYLCLSIKFYWNFVCDNLGLHFFMVDSGVLSNKLFIGTLDLLYRAIILK